jgi:hypothetical protein
LTLREWLFGSANRAAETKMKRKDFTKNSQKPVDNNLRQPYYQQVQTWQAF